jgi:hypothetical protein
MHHAKVANLTDAGVGTVEVSESALEIGSMMYSCR